MASTQYLTRKNLQCLRYDNVVAITVENLNVMSQEYRDLFNYSSTNTLYGTYSKPSLAPPSYPIETYQTTENIQSSGVTIIPDTGNLILRQIGFTDGAGNFQGTGIKYSSSTMAPTVSDEVAHHGLRQTELEITHWKIDRGTDIVPRYIHVTWADGDAWADYPVNQFVDPDA